MNTKRDVLMVGVALVAGLVGGMVSSWVLTGRPVSAQPTPKQAKVIRAESFEVVDKDGKVRAMFGMGEVGEPVLGLLDKDSEPHAELGLVQGEPTLRFADKDGKSRATFGYIELKNQRTGSVEKRSASSLVLFGEDGEVIWQAP